MAKWSVNLEEYTKQKGSLLNNIKNKFVFALYSAITQRTPVDSGRARGNWNVAKDNPDLEVDMDRKKPRYKNVDDIDQSQGDETMYISNSLPYINTLEYGGYPDPVKRGSYDKKKKTYVIKSDGGFSKQAPEGMFGVTIADSDRILKDVVKGELS